MSSGISSVVWEHSQVVWLEMNFRQALKLEPPIVGHEWLALWHKKRRQKIGRSLASWLIIVYHSWKSPVIVDRECFMNSARCEFEHRSSEIWFEDPKEVSIKRTEFAFSVTSWPVLFWHASSLLLDYAHISFIARRLNSIQIWLM
jgi:hypothetical protein